VVYQAFQLASVFVMGIIGAASKSPTAHSAEHYDQARKAA